MLKDFKEILPYFLGFFLLFLVIGFFAGWDKRQTAVINKIYTALIADVDARGYFLTHECNQQWTHRFYVEDNQIIKSADTHAKYLSELAYGPPSSHNIKHRDIILGLLGGATGGFSYKDFQNAINHQQKTSKLAALKKTIVGFIGAISGYAAGYWLGSHYDTDCDSAFALELLSKTTLWQTLEQQWVYFSITETEYGEHALIWKTSGKNINPLQDDPIVLCKTSLNKALMCLKSEIENSNKNHYDFNDRHFERLHKLTRHYHKIKQLPVYNHIKRLNMGKITKSNLALANHYGYTAENWDKACTLIEEKIRNAEFIALYSDTCLSQ